MCVGADVFSVHRTKTMTVMMTVMIAVMMMVMMTVMMIMIIIMMMIGSSYMCSFQKRILANMKT